MSEIQFNFMNHILILLLLLLSGLQIRVYIGKLFLYFSSKTYVVRTQPSQCEDTFEGPKHMTLFKLTHKMS